VSPLYARLRSNNFGVWPINNFCLFFLELHKVQSATLSASTCPRPYELIGTQCLFFSQPYLPWGLTETWAEAYLNYYDAVAVCRIQASNKGLTGDLASSVRNFEAAKRFCRRSRGACAPSLIRRDDQCYQWSPIDGSEIKITCKRWDVTMRYICEIKP
jgi:hypothetical protein